MNEVKLVVDKIVENNNKKITMEDINVSKNLVRDFIEKLDKNKLDLEGTLYSLLKIPAVNLNMYNHAEEPCWAVIGDNVLATECAAEFNLTPDKEYKIIGIGGGMVQIVNDDGVEDLYSVENFYTITKGDLNG